MRPLPILGFLVTVSAAGVSAVAPLTFETPSPDSPVVLDVSEAPVFICDFMCGICSVDPEWNTTSPGVALYMTPLNTSDCFQPHNCTYFRDCGGTMQASNAQRAADDAFDLLMDLDGLGLEQFIASHTGAYTFAFVEGAVEISRSCGQVMAYLAIPDDHTVVSLLK